MALPDFTPRVGNDPKSVVIHLTTGTGLDIEWKDGHRSSYTFPFLRDACPCALCEDERTKAKRKAEAPNFMEVRLARLHRMTPVGIRIQAR